MGTFFNVFGVIGTLITLYAVYQKCLKFVRKRTVERSFRTLFSGLDEGPVYVVCPLQREEVGFSNPTTHDDLLACATVVRALGPVVS